MQLYYGKELEIQENKLIITIPKDMYTISEFEKYQEIHCYCIAPKTINNKILTDDIQIILSPFEIEKFKNCYYIELRMKSVRGAFSHFLTLFDEMKINILECRAMDSADSSDSRVELLAELPEDLIEKTKKIENKNILYLSKHLCKEYLKLIDKLDKPQKTVINLGNQHKDLDPEMQTDSIFKGINDENELEFHKLPILLKKPIDNIFLEKYQNKKNELFVHYEKIKLSNKSDFDDQHKYFKLCFDTQNALKIKKAIQKAIQYSNCFMGITYVSEGRYIQAKVKSPEEEIVCLEVSVNDDNQGTLSEIISPLAHSGGNLRLIMPKDLFNNKTHYVYFNVEHTKMFGYSHKDIEKILKNDILKDVSSSFIILSENKVADVFTDDSLTKKIKDLSNKKFAEHINQCIKDLSRSLTDCSDNCNPKKCINISDKNNWRNFCDHLINFRLKFLNFAESEGQTDSELYKILHDHEINFFDDNINVRNEYPGKIQRCKYRAGLSLLFNGLNKWKLENVNTNCEIIADTDKVESQMEKSNISQILSESEKDNLHIDIPTT